MLDMLYTISCRIYGQMLKQTYRHVPYRLLRSLFKDCILFSVSELYLETTAIKLTTRTLDFWHPFFAFIPDYAGGSPFSALLVGQ